jgi:hypothetical protein
MEVRVQHKKIHPSILNSVDPHHVIIQNSLKIGTVILRNLTTMKMLRLNVASNAICFHIQDALVHCSSAALICFPFKYLKLVSSNAAFSLFYRYLWSVVIIYGTISMRDFLGIQHLCISLNGNGFAKWIQRLFERNGAFVSHNHP